MARKSTKVPDNLPEAVTSEGFDLVEGITTKRDRLLASLTLIAGIATLIGLPFALRAGAEFFMPVTGALVVAIALVPMLIWLERRGVPAKLSAGLCVIAFLAAMTFVIGSIVIPASNWIALVPQRIEKVRAALEPLLDLYKNLDTYMARIASQIQFSKESANAVHIETPNSMLGLLTTSAPHLFIQLFFALLVIYFFLAGWSKMRKQTIVSRGSFEGALTTARVIEEVVDATATYIGTITMINVGLGALTALILWFMGMESPIMWGGIVAVANFVPYIGPIISAGLLFIGGLMVYPDAWTALGPPAVFIGLHMIEANFFTPVVVGERLEISPLSILIALSFWAWVWGTIGALLAVPLLIIIKTVFSAAGTPDIAGFLFEHGTLTHVGDPDEEEIDERREMGPAMVDRKKPAT